MKNLVLASCAAIVLSIATAQAGPCDTGGKSVTTPVPDPLQVTPGRPSAQPERRCRASANKHDEPCDRRRRCVVPRRSETDAGTAYGRATKSGR